MANLAAVWFPMYIGWIIGQDTGIILLGMVVVMRTGSGLGYLMCLIKYHFMWLSWPSVPRRELLKCAGAMVILLAIPCLWNPGWIAQYYKTVVMGRAVISQTPDTAFAQFGWYAVGFGAVAAIPVTLWLNRQAAFAAAVALAVAVSPHGYLQDYTLCLPIVALCVEKLMSFGRADHRLSDGKAAAAGNALHV
jgi:hypothetical protein